MKDLKTLRMIGGTVGLTISLIGMAWSYGEIKKSEGQQEARKEFEIELLKIKTELLMNRKEEA